jgi:hypothetical protein
LPGNEDLIRTGSKKDFDSESTLSKVNADFKSGMCSGVNGTPSFLSTTGKLNYRNSPMMHLSMPFKSISMLLFEKRKSGSRVEHSTA